MLNRRYEEAIAYYRKAIELDPKLWSARSQLAINLMRLSQNDEAYKDLELCWNNGFQDLATKNTLKLMDSYNRFTTFKTDQHGAGVEQEGSRICCVRISKRR